MGSRPERAALRDHPWSGFPSFPAPNSLGQFLCLCIHTHPNPIRELNQERQGAPAAHQRKVVGVNPDNAQVGIIGVVPGNLLQDFQELKTI